MATLRKLTEMHMRAMHGGGLPGDDTRLDERVIAERIKLILPQLLQLEYYENYKEGDRLLPGMFTAVYEDLKIEKDRQGKYVVLPAFYLGLPYQKGIQGVWLDGKRDEPMMRRNNPHVSLGLECSYVTGLQSYFVQGRRLYFDRADADKQDSKVFVELVVALPEPIGMDDLLPVTEQMQHKILQILKSEDVPMLPEDVTSNEQDVNA